MVAGDRAVLQVYVEEGCALCRHSRELAEEASRLYPQLRVEVVDVQSDGSAPPDEVFAVPTFLLNGRVLFLGNPRASHLHRALRRALTEGEG